MLSIIGIVVEKCFISLPDNSFFRALKVSCKNEVEIRTFWLLLSRTTFEEKVYKRIHRGVIISVSSLLLKRSKCLDEYFSNTDSTLHFTKDKKVSIIENGHMIGEGSVKSKAYLETEIKVNKIFGIASGRVSIKLELLKDCEDHSEAKVNKVIIDSILEGKFEKALLLQLQKHLVKSDQQYLSSVDSSLSVSEESVLKMTPKLSLRQTRSKAKVV